MPNLGAPEILLILLVVPLLFGAKRLPDLAESVGKSLGILKSEVKDHDDDRPAGAAHDTAAPAAKAAPRPVAEPAPRSDAAPPSPPAEETEHKQP